MRTTTDIGMRLVVRVPNYEAAGALMDTIAAGVQRALEERGLGGTFDFTHVHTRPCKAARMEHIAMGDGALAEPLSDLSVPGPDDF
jgi:hypothetical protein